jgi:hypothetical protein
MKNLLACAFALLLTRDAGADRPHTRPIQITSFHSLATVQGTVTPKAICNGVDGVYMLLAVMGDGPITSDDPRMSGIFHADALILDSPVSGLGVSRDSWTITDPATGAVKVRGYAIATDLGPHPRAITVATLADGSHMVANSVVTLPAPGSTDPILIEYGGAGLEEPDRGVIVSGDDDCVELFF